MDFEKYQSRVDKGRKNMKRSDKDNAALAKAETELHYASEVRHHVRAMNWFGYITTEFSLQLTERLANG